MRRYSVLDRWIGEADKVLRTLAPQAMQAQRENPSVQYPAVELTQQEQLHTASLMRINHTGEVCAQALYQGQSLTARLPTVREEMRQAAKEEEDHLAWCEQRLTELGAQTSIFNPLWYGVSFGIGAVAGIAGDQWSLGFVAETEKQVCAHLQEHLQGISAQDLKTQAILQQMHDDEAKHMTMAIQAGAATLPFPAKALMAAMSKVMTRTVYYI